MGQVEALQMLGTVYDVRPVEGQPGSWVILRRGGPPFEPVGSVSFIAGRLAFAGRQWAHSASQDANRFASSVVDALRALTRDRAACSVAVQESPGPGSLPLGVVTITCEARSIQITGSRDERVAAAVGESIRAPR